MSHPEPTPTLTPPADTSCPPREVGPQGPVPVSEDTPESLRDWVLGLDRASIVFFLMHTISGLELLDLLRNHAGPAGVTHETLAQVRAAMAGRGLALLARERELGGPLDVGEALRVAQAQLDAARFELTVAHSAIQRLVEVADAQMDPDGCDLCVAIAAAREIVGGAS